MKKINLLFFLMFTIYTFSQQRNYGISTSIIMSKVEKSEEFNGGGSPGYRVGLFYEHELNNSFGLKSTLAIGKMQDGYYNDFFRNGTPNIFRTNLDLITLLRFYVKSNYSKGLFLTIGPRFTYINSALNDKNDVKFLYNETNFGLLFGFGFNTSEFFQIEFEADYGFTDILSTSEFKSKTLAGNITFSYDISHLLK